MKLRSGTVKTTYYNDLLQEPPIIPESVKLEINKKIDTLKHQLKDDPEFLKEIIDKLFDRRVYPEDIRDLLSKKYCYSASTKALGFELIHTVGDLGSLIDGNHPLIREEFQKLPITPASITKLGKISQSLYIEVKKEVLSNFCQDYPTEEGLVNVAGESEQSFNDMEG
jgi:hypothetical protein